MRTTLTLDDDVADPLKSNQSSDELVRRGGATALAAVIVPDINPLGLTRGHVRL